MGSLLTEELALEGDRTPQLITTPTNTGDKKNVLLSHLLTRLGDKMWEFIIPLVLMNISPTTLLPSALFGFVTTLARVLLATSIGTQIDIQNRLRVIRYSVSSQAISITISGLLLTILYQTKTSAMVDDIFATWQSSFLVCLLLISAAFGSLAALAMDISIEKDWIPVLFTESQELTLLNTRVRQIDLATEISGPFLVGILLIIPGVNMIVGFSATAIINFITFLPQYLLLKVVYQRNEILQQNKLSAGRRVNVEFNEELVTYPPSKDRLKRFCCGKWNPIANLVSGWSLFIKQPINLVVIGFAFFWFTVLSPHDPVLTAYLNSIGFSSLELALFRGIGAMVGIISTFLFPIFTKKYGVKTTSLMYCWEEAVCITLATLFFFMGDTLNGVDANMYIFIIFIALSRCGLYGFEIGEVQLLQQGVPESIRGEVCSVESSITSLFGLLVSVTSFFFSKPSQFKWLVMLTLVAIFVGSVIFSIWCSFYSVHDDEHSHIDNEHNDHEHLHSTEQNELLKTVPMHKHLHFHRRKKPESHNSM